MEVKPQTKKLLNVISLLILLISIILFAITFYKANQLDKAKKNKVRKKLELQKINFKGSIQPSIAKVGKTVLIKIEVENLGDKPINDVKILFSDKKFIEEGLIVTNVMDNGVQDGSKFKWNNDIMRIPPKEKRTFQISAKANKPGKYETTIQIKPMNGMETYSDKLGNQELKTKLVITQ